jgi:hypothetical protein
MLELKYHDIYGETFTFIFQIRIAIQTYILPFQFSAVNEQETYFWISDQNRNTKGTDMYYSDCCCSQINAR